MEMFMPHINHHRGETRRSVNREVRCSCSMCGNPRRNGWGGSRTFQELLAPLPTEEEPLAREWKTARKGPKRFSLHKRRIGRDGVPGTWWVELKAYRKKKDRDNALEALRKSVRCYTWPRFRERETVYTGPVYEYRVGETRV